MKNQHLATSAVVAFLVGVGSFGIAVADSSEEQPFFEPSDVAPETLDPSAAGDGGSTPPRLRPALPDSGPSADVASARRSVAILLAATDSAARIPAEDLKMSKKEKLSQHLSVAAKVERRQGLRGSLTLKKLDEVLPLVEEGLELNLTDPRYADSAYSDNEFVVTQHEGVEVTGSTATLLLRGYHRYKGMDTLWWSTAPAQYQVVLVKSQGSKREWLLDSWTAVLLSDASEPAEAES